MPLNLKFTSGQVRHAVEIAKKNKPSYTEMLDFYGRIFEIQEESKRRIQLQPLQISREARTVGTREKFPIIAIEDFVFDEVEAGKLFLELCHHAKKSNPKLAADAEAVLKAVGKVIIKPAELFRSLLNGKNDFYEKIAGEIKIAVTTLGFLSYNSLKPSLSMCADQLSFYLDDKEPWLKGYCPICGSPPILSILEGGGGRYLICSFCWHPWAARRVFCPFCENPDNKAQHYFYSEEEEEFRVDLCDRCKKYLKTIDSRKTERMIYPPLEQISSLHLDYTAGEMGYESGVRLIMQE